MSDDDAPDAEVLASEANYHAGRSTQAWLTGRGLADEIERFRNPPDGDPIPTPGLDDLLIDLGTACMDACNAADATFTLVGDGMDDNTSAAAQDSVAVAGRAAVAAEAAMRRIAETLLGVTTRSAANDAVSRAERAAVVTLVAHPTATDVVGDGVKLGARTYEELVTELSGVLCRMIIDHDAVLRLAPTSDEPRRALLFAVNAVGDLDVLMFDESLPTDESTEDDALVELGWQRQGAGMSAHWDDPLPVMEPARLTVETLRDAWGLAEPLDLIVYAERQGPESWGA